MVYVTTLPCKSLTQGSFSNFAFIVLDAPCPMELPWISAYTLSF